MTSDKPNKEFHSDGCSVVGPVARFFGYHNEKIKDCCITHDKTYWAGGTLAKKREVDRLFRECLIRAANVPDFIARLMWFGVVIGGFIPHPNFRWGFGWKFPRYK